MKTTPRSLMFGISALLLASACADRQRKGDTADRSDRTEPKAGQVVHTYGDNGNRLSSRTISFARGSAMLSADSRKQLQDLVQVAKARGDIQDIKVSVWSDREFPDIKNAELLKADRTLADRRADTIENYLEDVMDTPSVETFSMAERPNWFSRMIQSDEAELKSTFARRSYRLSDAQFELLRGGEVSKAVVVIETDE